MSKMPRELTLGREHFAKKKVSVFDCLVKTETAFKFEVGKDFKKGTKPKNIIHRVKEWARAHSLKVLVTVEDDGSIIAWSESLTPEELQARQVSSERMRRHHAAKAMTRITKAS